MTNDESTQAHADAILDFIVKWAIPGQERQMLVDLSRLITQSALRVADVVLDSVEWQIEQAGKGKKG